MNNHLNYNTPLPDKVPSGKDTQNSRGSGPFEPYLFADERLLWYGQPSEISSGFSWCKSRAIMMAAWGLFAGIFVVSLYFRLNLLRNCSLVYFVVALFTLHSPFNILKNNRRRTHYAVTNRRLLILVRGGAQTHRGFFGFRELKYDMLDRVLLIPAEGDPQSGTLVFISNRPLPDIHSGPHAAKRSADTVLYNAFIDIRGAAAVNEIIRQAMS